MCGRFARPLTDQEIADEFGVAARIGDALPPSWNVAPTQEVRIVVERPVADHPSATQRQLRTARWGLVPFWAKSPSGGARMINARVETLLEKPTFREAAVQRRAVVPMSGYFEWEPGPSGKIPHYLSAADHSLLAAAGIYSFWRATSTAPWLVTCAIVTTEASDTLGHIHNRAPLLLSADSVGTWLDPRLADASEVAALLAALPQPHLVPVEVGRAVGNVRNNGPELIEPVVGSKPEAVGV